MTKQEFINRAIISMCANPKFSDDVTVDKRNIIDQAYLLANQVEDEFSEPFDEDIDETRESMKALIGNIDENLLGIREAMEKPSGDTLSAFQEIASVLNEIRSQLCKGVAVGVISEDE